MTDQVSAAGVRVAVIQTQPVFGDISGNLDAIEASVIAAARSGTRLVVLPELCVTGYMFADKDEALDLAEEIPSGRSAQRLISLASGLGVHLVAGFAERDGDFLFNSALIAGPNGLVGRYRKLHLWDRENEVFEPGDLGLPVFETELGRIGILICYDLWFPEAMRTLALRGADVVCVPTNWVPIPGQREGEPGMALSLCQAGAHVNGVHVLAADRVGVERGQEFIGQSVIVGPTGWPLVEPAPYADPQTVIATADLHSGEVIRRWGEFNNPLADRRPDTYDLDSASLSNGS